MMSSMVLSLPLASRLCAELAPAPDEDSKHYLEGVHIFWEGRLSSSLKKTAPWMLLLLSAKTEGAQRHSGDH